MEFLHFEHCIWWNAASCVCVVVYFGLETCQEPLKWKKANAGEGAGVIRLPVASLC